MKIKDIHINPKNPRYIKDDRYLLLKRNLKEFPKMMKLRPIIVDDSGMILGGNMRYLAMIDLGYKEIPEGWVVKASELSEEERERFKILDNVPFGNWDFDILANEWDLEKLQDWGVEIPEIEMNIEAEKDDFDVDKAVEEVGEPVCKKGDIWQLGEHRLMCGDATVEADVKRLIDGKKINFLLTDPPYGIDLDTDWTKMTGSKKLRIIAGKKRNDIKGGKYNQVIGDKEIFDINYFLKEFKEIKEQFWFGGDYYCQNLPKGGNWIIWDKRLNEYFDKILGSPFEVIWSKFPHRKEIIRILYAGLIGFKEDTKKRVHPTQKPVELFNWIIKKYNKKGNDVLDLFGGSGTTLIACEQLNRICYMMEIDPIYCDVIIKRWEQYTNKKAVMINVRG